MLNLGVKLCAFLCTPNQTKNVQQIYKRSVNADFSLHSHVHVDERRSAANHEARARHSRFALGDAHKAEA